MALDVSVIRKIKIIILFQLLFLMSQSVILTEIVPTRCHASAKLARICVKQGTHVVETLNALLRNRLMVAAALPALALKGSSQKTLVNAKGVK